MTGPRSQPNSEPWDLAIVGAGPAGTASALGALHAQPDLRVLLLDRADFPRDKACGDGIAPHAVDVLAAVGVHGLLDDQMPVHRLELTHGEAKVSRAMKRPAYVVPRAEFDARLLAAAVAAGAWFRRGRVRGVRAGSSAVAGEVAVDVAGATTVRARTVIAADGAHSVLRAAVSAAPGGRRVHTRPRTALALRGYAPVQPAARGRQRIVFGTRRQPAYAWSFDRGDGVANVGYGELLTGDGPAPSRVLLLAELDRLLPGAGDDAEQWRGHHLPLSSWPWQQPGGRILLAGDAAQLINPLTGEGIYYAVATGVLAGRCAVQSLRGQHCGADAGRLHRQAVRALLGRHLLHTRVGASLVSRPALVRAAVRAAAADQRVFDDLVEVGLGRGCLTASTVVAAVRELST